MTHQKQEGWGDKADELLTSFQYAVVDLEKADKLKDVGIAFEKKEEAALQIGDFIRTEIEKAERRGREKVLEKAKVLLEDNLRTEEYFGVYGEVNLKKFFEDLNNPE